MSTEAETVPEQQHQQEETTPVEQTEETPAAADGAEGDNIAEANGEEQEEAREEGDGQATQEEVQEEEPVEKEDTLEYFLQICDQFKLGALPTESSNPATENLSELAQTNLPAAFRVLQDVDIAAVKSLEAAVPQVEELARSVHEVLTSGHQVILVGCGATGRLSLSVEIFALEGIVAEPEYQTKVKGFMAGGDAALIRSIEKFEDRNEFGARQLHELNFTDGDLLLAITEGGETPFVIAACEEAFKVGPSVKPYFIYCNPDEILCEVAERSKNVIENEGIKKINVCVGPMAITGSTRMQATTVQLTVAGLAIQNHAKPEVIRSRLRLLTRVFETVKYEALAPMTTAEAKLYADKECFLYETDYFSITTMTDTTERAPTFSLPPFENFDREEATSPVYLCLPGTDSVEASWKRLLRRDWRPLEWEETAKSTGLAALQGYDFSDNLGERRSSNYGSEKTQHRIRVEKTDSGFRMALVRHMPKEEVGNRVGVIKRETSVAVALGVALGPDAAEDFNSDRLLLNIVVKAILNAHSTLIMGILGRFEGNVMTYVKPSNYKLIDRAARYVQLILSRSGKFSDQTPPAAAAVEETPAEEAVPEENTAAEESKPEEAEATPEVEAEAEQNSEEKEVEAEAAPAADEEATTEDATTAAAGGEEAKTEEQEEKAQEEEAITPAAQAPPAVDENGMPYLPSYELIVERIFEFRGGLLPDEPIVLKVANAFLDVQMDH